MGYEIALATLIGSISSIITILLWQRGTWKKMDLQHKYDIKRYKLGKQYKLKESQLPKKQQKGLMDQLLKLDKDTISRALEFLAPGEELDEEPGGIEGILRNVISNNPDAVQEFLAGLGQGMKSKNKPDTTRFYEH